MKEMKFKSVKECDNILALFENKEPTHSSQFNEEFASFRKDVVSVLQSQQPSHKSYDGFTGLE